MKLVYSSFLISSFITAQNYVNSPDNCNALFISEDDWPADKENYDIIYRNHPKWGTKAMVRCRKIPNQEMHRADRMAKRRWAQSKPKNFWKDNAYWKCNGKTWQNQIQLTEICPSTETGGWANFFPRSCASGKVWDPVNSKCAHPDTIDPPGSWPALELDASVENEGIEVSVSTEYAADMAIYHVIPETPSNKAVIVNYDIFGMNMGRLRSVCDQIAQDTGFHVLMPDYFRDGDGVGNYGGFPFTDEGFNWFSQFNSERVLNDTNAVYGYMINAGYVIESWGSVGYCWGAWSGFWQATTGAISAQVSAHPSLQVEDFIGNGQESLVKAVAAPVLLLPTGPDPESVKPGGDVENWLENDANQTVEIYEFSEMEHGFVPRGDISVPEVERDVKLAMEKTVEFLKEHM